MAALILIALVWEAGFARAHPLGLPVRPATGTDDLVQSACSLPHDQLLRIWRGFRPARSGDIVIVPHEPNFMGEGISHSGPWDYLQRVPLFLYGPGYIREVGRIGPPVTVADLAPTFAELLGFDLSITDGEPLVEALVPPEDRPLPPRLILTVVWDAGGRVVLDRWRDAWPALRGLIPSGAWFANASVGSSPSVTPQIHATIGTGTFPRRHGLVDDLFRLGGGITGPWRRGPILLLEPTLADLYDRAMANRPLVGMVATVAWHLGMIGHGSMWFGGDRDLAVVRNIAGENREHPDEGRFWTLPVASRDFFRFPEYINELPPISTYFPAADLADGTPDGTWRGHEVAGLRGGLDTPARLPYQSRVIREIMRREGFGADAVPDLFYLNYKLIDEVGHSFTLDSLEMRDTLQTQDRELLRLTRFLDRRVGPGRWVLALTADHGHTPNPELTGAIRISPSRLASAVGAAFDDSDGIPVVQLVQPSQIFLNLGELSRGGRSLENVARFVQALTAREIASAGTAVPPGVQDSPVFAAVFPSSLLPSLPCLPEARMSPPS